MPDKHALVLGLDFGTESVRALFVDLDGHEHGWSSSKYKHGQITAKLPGTNVSLPPDYALQHPGDWLDSAAKATRSAWRRVGNASARIIGIGVDFTSCTMLPTLGDGTPLCMASEHKANPLAWPKLWKHHAAKTQTERIDQIASQRKEQFLEQCGGTIGLEWFFPKMLETLDEAPEVYRGRRGVGRGGRLGRVAADRVPSGRDGALDMPGRVQGHVDIAGRIPLQAIPAGGPPRTC